MNFLTDSELFLDLDKQVMHKAELEVDYFNNLSRCVERLEGKAMMIIP